ncbi:MAG TPA: Tn3 family transposase [Bacteroidales bacterium]|nr:Tn3 family transposase [Bacteroidales bacterium]
MDAVFNMVSENKSLTRRRRYQPISLPQEFSDEEMARDWTLTEHDLREIGKYRKTSRLFISVQICSVRLYGRFINEVDVLSPRIVNYLNGQLGLSPSITVKLPDREATYIEYRKNILNHLGFRKFDADAQAVLQEWLERHSGQGVIPDDLFKRAERYLLSERVVLPGASVLERMVIGVCLTAHDQIFEEIYRHLSPEVIQSIDKLLITPAGEHRSFFYQLKEYPPAAKVKSLRNYLQRYRTLTETGINDIKSLFIESAFQDYFYKLAKGYNARDIKRFKDHKRYSLMTCFLLETRKVLLDHLVKMHDQYIMDMCRHSGEALEKKHREIRKKQKKAVDTVVGTTRLFLDWPDDEPIYKRNLLKGDDERKLRESIDDLNVFRRLEERGYGDQLQARYPSLRKYFAEFIHLPFAAEQGSNDLMKGIEMLRRLDSGELKRLPDDAPLTFVPKELRRALKDYSGNIARNAWELGLALAIKDALRSGDLYLPQSRQHVSFWNLMLDEARWRETRESSFVELNQPQPQDVKGILVKQFDKAAAEAGGKFGSDDFARMENGRLRLKHEDKAAIPITVINLQKVIDSSMPSIRIENLLMEVDKLTRFSRHFVPIQQHNTRPNSFYKTLLAAIISQATNLGVVSMSSSVKDVTVDMLRNVLQFYIREETLKAASAEIVNQHHHLPFSAIHGSGTISSSDAQRFKVRASSLLASYYPRYYGYYEKAIGIYTHVSDQYSVFSTKIISCSPREALYVLDGLLENNTILKIKEHTTDTHGYTEIVFALCYLLGYYFMPRIRDLKDQQLYRVDRNVNYGELRPLLNKTADLDIVEEQWEPMIRVAKSLIDRTSPAHVIVQRLTNSFPSDRLSKAFTNLGRIIKTEYILRYITDPALRRTVQLQLNKGEYRHKLPRWIFFANQGEFSTGDYEEIMNKASCLSLVSNAILYWNTIKINSIVESLKRQGDVIENDTLSHISLLPYKHVLPNGTYFIDEDQVGGFVQKPTVSKSFFNS